MSFFRIGGTKLLRGFNEEALFVRSYSVTTAEYRLLFSKDSNVFAFADYAIVRLLQGNDFTTSHPLGLGLGLNLETKLGVFTISYAVGRQDSQPLSVRSGRIHFGMVTLF